MVCVDLTGRLRPELAYGFSKKVSTAMNEDVRRPHNRPVRVVAPALCGRGAPVGVTRADYRRLTASRICVAEFTTSPGAPGDILL